MKQRVSLITFSVGDLGRARRFYEALDWSTSAALGDYVLSAIAGSKMPR